MTRPDRPASGKEHNAAYAGVAAHLRANGYSPVPLSDKRPTIAGWPAIFCERLPSLEEIKQEWSVRRRGAHVMNGVGVATAHGLVIIDVDDDAAIERVLAIVPQARTAPACVGQRGRKIFVRAADGKNVRERNITGASMGGAVEVLSWHRQGVIPPTLHPKTGLPYIWVDDRVTLITIPLHHLPTISDAEIGALRAAFAAANKQPVGREKPAPGRAREVPVEVAGIAPADYPPCRWWEVSTNRARIEELVRLFGIVHRAARDQGGRIILQADGVDAAGKPHRPETIDIDDTQHWKHVVRIIVDELGNTEEAYSLHVEVSRGNAMLALPGGPATYEEVGNRKFFDSVVDARTFEAKSGKRPRTLRTLLWWVRMIEGRPPVPQRERRKSLVTALHGTVARLREAGVEPNIAAARQRAGVIFRPGSKRLAIVNESLDYISRGGGTTWMTDIADVAALHRVSVRAVQSALLAAERAGTLVRTRGNEGGKRILLTVPVVVQRATGGNTLNRKSSPSLHRRRGVCGIEVIGQRDTTDDSPAHDDERDDDWLDRPQEPPAPFGRVRQPVNEEDQQALNLFVEEARRGRCTEETLLLAGILPPDAAGILLQIVEQNRAGRKAGAKWLRHIAGEIGELILSEPERWPRQLQAALNQVAVRLERTNGRSTSAKWARIFAENVGYIHERAGRLTPMARAAAAARQRRKKSKGSDDEGG